MRSGSQHRKVRRQEEQAPLAASRLRREGQPPAGEGRPSGRGRAAERTTAKSLQSPRTAPGDASGLAGGQALH